MTLSRLIIFVTLAVMSLAGVAQSQDLMGFDRASFGSVVLSRTQAVGTGIQLEISVGSYENEPMSNYKDTVFADIGRSVGRLDALTDKGVFPCTAFIVSKQHILTNYHCSLGLLDDERIGATRIDASQFIAGYTQTGVDEGTKKYTVIPTPVEYSEELDYAVLEVIGNPSKEYGKLKLASLVPNDRAPFWIIGHPQGKGQHISREKCRASTPAISRNTLLHTCDTLPGNSGSPVIDAGLQVVVALHHAGIANDSVNAAILMSKILENSTVLAAYKAPEDVPKSQPVEPKTAANSACDALYSATAETKACYAYDAYLKSCADHALAPLARGYINEFCQPIETVKVDKVPEQTCDDDPSLCSTDQLCGQSLTFKSGKAAWRTDNVSYVTEAKRRGLSCGVIEVVATPKKTCSQTAKSCNTAGLCQAATIISGGKYAWNKIYKKSYVSEAKRRGLTCGVTEAVATPNGQCQGSYNAATWDNCIGTWSDGKGFKYSGQFKDGKYNGQGTTTFANGDKYVGQYEDGKYNGQGT
ncbi:trypsin-like peptidase domain-containing protein [Paracoccaceae bacterium]|nr:trypsin-like peptidase domain-containing protein [Paracoccaceae bacterium]